MGGHGGNNDVVVEDGKTLLRSRASRFDVNRIVLPEYSASSSTGIHRPRDNSDVGDVVVLTVAMATAAETTSEGV